MATRQTPEQRAALAAAAAKAARTERISKRVMRYSAIAGLLPVLYVAARISYFHIAHLAMAHGYVHDSAYLLPVAIDGMMFVCSIAMIADRSAKLPMIMFLLGAGVSLLANAASVTHPDPTGYLLAGFPSIALVGIVEVILRLCLPKSKSKNTFSKWVAKRQRARKAAVRNAQPVTRRLATSVASTA